MIPIALLEKFGSLTFITGIEISHMTRHSSELNKLRNVNPVRDRMGNVTIKKTEHLLYQNQSHKTCLMSYANNKAHINLLIRAIWPAPLLFAS